MSRSLKVAPEHIPQVKLALKRSGFPSQIAFAEEMKLSRATIVNFLKGIGVDYTNFVDICERLGLDWQDISGIKKSPLPDPEPKKSIDALVQEVREKVKPSIEVWCGQMKVLDMSGPIALTDIYTKVNILEKLTARNSTGIDELQQNVDPTESFDRLGIGKIAVPRVDALEAVNTYPKLMLWGKPGAGKTTFLKHLAIQCVSEKIQIDKVPVYIEFDRFAIENYPNFLDFFYQILANCEVTNSQTNELLKAGRMFILIDGLDEVKEEDSRLLIKHLDSFLKSFHKNQYIITCRLAGQKFSPENFVEVEVADFSKEEITHFVSKWFDSQLKGEKSEPAPKPKKADKFLKKLYSQKNRSIQELANNPLLLTLMCLVFKDSEELSSNRFDLYRTAIDILLDKWDNSREKERRKIYKKLSASGRRDLLSYIAYKTFKNGQYYFTLDTLKEYIADYIRTLPDTDIKREELLKDSEDIVESIEAQHGLLVKRATPNIYSFSHLTFHEYFTARQITFPSSPPEYDEALRSLLNYLTDNRWREVFLRVTERVQNADYIIRLMKEQIDNIVDKDESLQNFLTWVNQKSLSFDIEYKRAAIRAFYLNIDLEIDVDRRLGCLIDFTCTCVFTCASFLAHVIKSDITPSLLNKGLELASELANNEPDLEPDIAIALERILALDILKREFGDKIEPEMRQKLENLKNLLPQQDGNNEMIKEWEKVNRRNWADQVRVLIVVGREIGEDHWHNFTECQQHRLKQYYEANLLLLDCMKNAHINPEVLQEIENTLLLPRVEIERLKNKG
jgi:predicted NACHT family NTPase